MAAEDGKIPGSETSVEDLARRLMDLWQEQMAAIAADPDLMRQMARMMAASPFPAMMQGVMQGIMAATAQSGAGGSNPYEWWKSSDAKPGSAQSSTETRAPAAAPASQSGGGDLAELRRSLAGLEARLAELGGSQSAKPEPAKPRSEKPKRPARKPQKPVAGPAGGSGAGGTGGTGGGAAG